MPKFYNFGLNIETEPLCFTLFNSGKSGRRLPFGSSALSPPYIIEDFYD